MPNYLQLNFDKTNEANRFEQINTAYGFCRDRVCEVYGARALVRVRKDSETLPVVLTEAVGKVKALEGTLPAYLRLYFDPHVTTSW